MLQCVVKKVVCSAGGPHGGGASQGPSEGIRFQGTQEGEGSPGKVGGCRNRDPTASGPVSGQGMLGFCPEGRLKC